MGDYSPAVYATIFALLPPLVAIVMALLTKEVYSSLILGVAVGSMLYANGNPVTAFHTMFFDENGGLVSALSNPSHVCIMIFVVLLWSLVAVMNKSGSAAAFGRHALKHVKTREGAQIAAVLMGFLIFVDDGFNCLTVGSVMRPISDRYKVSRAKLAYIIDSTAAPVCIIAPVSSWAAAVSYSVPESMHINGFEMFIKTIPYNLYALCTIVMLFSIILFKVDFGPMKLHEENAKKGDLFTSGETPYEEDAAAEKPDAKISNLVIPIFSLILFCVMGMLYTGGFFEGASVREAFADTDAAKGMVIGSAITITLTFLLYMVRRALKFKEFMGCLASGFRNVCEPLLILILAWNLSGITGMLGADAFIRNVVNSMASGLTAFLPAVIFAISIFLAFSTGTSWGTFSILIPIVCAVFPDNYEMLVISISACLAGAVCGDHCSPISDTTIMSSAGAGSDHVNHTTTQLPYALTAAGVSFAGYLLLGITGYITGSAIALVATPITLLLMVLVIFMIRKIGVGRKTAAAPVKVRGSNRQGAKQI
uniref:Na+/H+ antiporter NhaC family protein n=1 Tax=Eubacterium cellulosolvens TaxID=29322 RepID=UPI0006891B14|nr:Na+/H+ antiporter NhaC family protein [[Eubacterium] cellulosolvens]